MKSVLSNKLQAKSNDLREYYLAATKYLPIDAGIIYNQFRGDPAEDANFKPRLLTNLNQLDPQANIYWTVAAMRQNDKGEWRRRKDNFAGGLLLMIDDLGSGPGAKFPLDMISVLAPTALIETSPDNFQAIYMFDTLVEDQREFNALIDAFVRKQFLGNDTGMTGVTRVYRPPAGINGKPKYGGRFQVRLANFEPQRRYSVNDLCRYYELVLAKRAPKKGFLPLADAVVKDRVETFQRVYKELYRCGMIKGKADESGWIEMSCPWSDRHTGGVDNGAAIKLPDVSNSYHGAYKCHHGGCAGKEWRMLTDFIAEGDAELMEEINQNHKQFEEMM